MDLATLEEVKKSSPKIVRLRPPLARCPPLKSPIPPAQRRPIRCQRQIWDKPSCDASWQNGRCGPRTKPGANGSQGRPRRDMHEERKGERGNLFSVGIAKRAGGQQHEFRDDQSVPFKFVSEWYYRLITQIRSWTATIITRSQSVIPSTPGWPTLPFPPSPGTGAVLACPGG